MWLAMVYNKMQPIKLHSSLGQTADTQFFGAAAVHKTWHDVNHSEETAVIKQTPLRQTYLHFTALN